MCVSLNMWMLVPVEARLELQAVVSHLKWEFRGNLGPCKSSCICNCQGGASCPSAPDGTVHGCWLYQLCSLTEKVLGNLCFSQAETEAQRRSPHSAVSPHSWPLGAIWSWDTGCPSPPPSHHPPLSQVFWKAGPPPGEHWDSSQLTLGSSARGRRQWGP